MKYDVTYTLEAGDLNEALSVAYLAISDDGFGDQVVAVRVADADDRED